MQGTSLGNKERSNRPELPRTLSGAAYYFLKSTRHAVNGYAAFLTGWCHKESTPVGFHDRFLARSRSWVVDRGFKRRYDPKLKRTTRAGRLVGHFDSVLICGRKSQLDAQQRGKDVDS
jgi:hypothetical protein